MARFSRNQMRWLPIREDFQVHFNVHSHQPQPPPAVPRLEAAEQVDLKKPCEWFNDQIK